jgi:putative FmdB family regulatory protein
MPIYEYRCPHCGKEFEKLVPMNTDPRNVECPHCGQKGVEKKMSLFGMGGNPLGGFAVSQGSSCGTGGST